MTEKKPNKRVIRKWVKALRSGDYRQGRNYLSVKNKTNDNFRHCCLGVLCEIAPKSLKLEPTIITAEDGTTNVLGYGKAKDYSVLPKEVIDWAGLPDFNPDVKESPNDKWGQNLSHFNDARKYNFNQIADLLEDNFLKD